jgi:hypothetical protein
MGFSTWNVDPAILGSSRSSRYYSGGLFLSQTLRQRDCFKVMLPLMLADWRWVCRISRVEFLLPSDEVACLGHALKPGRVKLWRRGTAELRRSKGANMPFSQPRENLEAEHHQPHNYNSPLLTSVCPFHVLRFDLLYDTLLLMFRIFVATGRSVQQRSTTTLRYLRPFQSTVSIPRNSSTTAEAIEYQTETQPSSVGMVHSDSLPSHNTKGTAPAANETSDSKTEPKRSRRAKSNKENDDPAEDSSSKTIKRGGRPRKKPKVNDDTAEPGSGKSVKTRKPRGKKAQNPEDAEVKAASNTKRRPPKSSKRPKVEQSGGSSASPGSSIVVEERTRKASFTSQDIRADVLPYLQWTRGGVSVGKAIGDKKRLNIVSELLCGMTSKLRIDRL